VDQKLFFKLSLTICCQKGIGIWAKKYRKTNPSFARRQLHVLVDSATFHAKTAKKILKKDHKVVVHLLPPHSPDLSILDSCLWQGVLKQQVQQERRKDYAAKQIQKPNETKKQWKARLLEQATQKLYKAARQITKAQVKKYEREFRRRCRLIIKSKDEYECRKT